MKNTCVIPVDPAGRLVLPRTIRSAMQIAGRDELAGELNSETGELRLWPVETRCRNCGVSTGLHRLGSLVLCDSCIEELKNG